MDVSDNIFPHYCNWAWMKAEPNQGGLRTTEFRYLCPQCSCYFQFSPKQPQTNPLWCGAMDTKEAASSSATSHPQHRLSCITYFDALGFCYTPVHQMQQYYRHGVFDNCYDKWNALFDCFHLKTKRSSEVQEILEDRERSKTHIWTMRTPEEASRHWKELFGDVNDGE